MFSESSDYENVDIESDRDFGPEIARKVKETVRYLCSDLESWSAKQQDSDDKSDIYTAEGGEARLQEQYIVPNLKLFLRKFRSETNTCRLC